MYLHRQVTLVFTVVTSKNDVTLCKLNVNVKNQTAVAGSVDFLDLSRNSSKENVLLYCKFYFENQKVCKKKYLSWVYGVDRKIRHWVSLFGITREAS